MSAPPYMKLYVADYLGDTHHLGVAEHGAYLLLLMAMWRAGGSLPAADMNLARLARCTSDQWAAIKPVVLPLFKRSRSRISHKRVSEEMAKYDVVSRQRSEAGKRRRSGKANENSAPEEAIAERETSNCPHNQNQNQNQIKEEEGSEDKSSDGKPSLVSDPNWTAWQVAIDLLARAGIPEKSARGIFGRILSQNGLEARDMLPALATGTLSETLDPVAYLTKAAQGIAKRREPTRAKRVGFV